MGDKMKKSSVTANYMYNVIYEVLTILTPLITAPYLARTLGATKLGIYSYTYSIVYWFMLFGLMGMNVYGRKEIAKVSSDRDKLSQRFSELYYMQLINVFVCLIVYYLFFGLTNFEYKEVFLIQGIMIVSTGLDIVWLFAGLECFKRTTIRNCICKIFTVVGTLLLIKTKNDLNLYVFYLSIMTLLSQFILWADVKNHLSLKRVQFKDIVKHYKTNFLLFIPSIATTLYSVFDQTMIGLLYKDVSEVSFYYQAHRLVQMLMFIITTIGTVMMPRAVKLRVEGRDSEIKELTNFTCKIALFLSIPMAVGFSTVAPYFIPWFLTEEFTRVGYIIGFLAPTMIFTSFTNVLGLQFLIVYDENKKYTISVVAGSIVNVILNAILIKKFGAYGAAFASSITAGLVFLIQYKFVKGRFDFSGIPSKFIRYFLVSTAMGIVVILIGQLLGVSIVTNIIQSIAGIFIYVLAMYLLKDNVFFFLIEKALKILKIKR